MEGVILNAWWLIVRVQEKISETRPRKLDLFPCVGLGELLKI